MFHKDNPATREVRTYALAVKAADRLCNVRRGGKTDLYRREHAAFRAAAGLVAARHEEL